MNDSLLYAIAFSQIHGINLYERKKIINVFGNAMSIFNACQQGGNAFVDLELKCIDSLMAAWPLKAAAEELSSMKRLGIDATCIEDAVYPNRLFQCEDAPTILFTKGSKKWNLPYLISIVGTRNHTRYADKVIQELRAKPIQEGGMKFIAQPVIREDLYPSKHVQGKSLIISVYNYIIDVFFIHSFI